jgi:hypothetical protein
LQFLVAPSTGKENWPSLTAFQKKTIDLQAHAGYPIKARAVTIKLCSIASDSSSVIVHMNTQKEKSEIEQVVWGNKDDK